MTKPMRMLAVLASLLFIASACTTSPPAATPGPTSVATQGAPATEAPDTRRVELTFATWSNTGDIPVAYAEMIESFVASEPRVTAIKYEFQPFQRYGDVLNVQLAGGKPPDIAWIPFNVAPVYLDAGALYNLKPTLQGIADYDFDDLRPSALAPYTRGDELYAIPFTNSTNVLYYNIDIFEAAGAKTPDQLIAEGSYTWENLKAQAKLIVDSGAGRYGMHFANNMFTNGWRILEDLWAPYGGGPWSTDGKTCRFNAPETVAATQLVWDMIYTDRSHPEPGVDISFFAGDIGMDLSRPSNAFNLENVTFRWGITRAPEGPAGYVPVGASNGIAALAGGENPDLAAAFVAHATSVASATRMGRNFPSARLSLQQLDILAAVNPIMTAEQIEIGILGAITNPNASWGYSHVNWGPLFSNAQRVFDGSLWKPDADVKAGLDQVCADVSGLLG